MRLLSTEKPFASREAALEHIGELFEEVLRLGDALNQATDSKSLTQDKVDRILKKLQTENEVNTWELFAAAA